MAREDLKWANDHAQEYPGRWLAVKDGALLRSAETLDELIGLLDQVDGGDQALLIDPWWTGDRKVFWR